MKSLVSYIALVKNHLISNVFTLRDFRTNRHIVVFESDDWGSIRMSNKRAWDELLKMGYAVDKRPYERCDTLESEEDLEALFEILLKHKDYNGCHPVITANMLMANPDFERIEKSDYQEYYYELISDTYNRYYGNTKVLDLMRQGYTEGVFMPQSHGREHFNVAKWMEGLQSGNEDLLTAFRYGMCGVSPKNHPNEGNKMMKALWAEDMREQKQINEIVGEGLQLFERIWGFKSKTFVAPCYCWNDEIEKVLNDSGVQLIQSSRTKKSAYNSPRCNYYAGYRNHYGQIISIRNCTFEPSTIPNDNSLIFLMRQIDSAFVHHRLAIISTHRINYVSSLNKQNRTNNLRLLDQFFNSLSMKYPDVEFVSSDKLVNIYNESY